MAFNRDDVHGAYLIFFKSTQETIKNKDDLISILRETGRCIDDNLIAKYWKSSTKEITFEEFINICRDIPIITKSDLVRALKEMDVHKCGYLDATEFIKTFATPDFKLSRRDITNIVRKIDFKNEGKLYFEEVANLLLSNMDDFKQLGRAKIAEKERNNMSQGGDRKRNFSGTDNKQNKFNFQEEEEIDSGKREKQKSIDGIEEIRIDKIISSRFEYNEPKNLKSWRKTTLRGCLFLGDENNSNSAQDPNIESYVYKFTVNTSTNVFITMSPLTILRKLDLKQVPDLGFIILNKTEEIVGLSMPVDAGGSTYFSGNLLAGSYVVYPFTTGAKLKSKTGDAKDNFSNINPLKRDAKGEYLFTNEIMAMLEDIFKICDIDGNGYLSKDEFVWYSSKTSEGDWEEDLWTELKNSVTLQNNELSFSNFTNLIMAELEQEKFDTAPLFLTLDLFGFTDKCMIEEAFPFSINFHVENSDYLVKSFGIQNKIALIESCLRDFTIKQGERLTSKQEWRDCDFYMWGKCGRILVAVENNNSVSRQVPVRLNINMDKSTNLTVYKDKLQRNVSIASGTKILAVHGVPIEPKVPISCSCSIRRS